MSQKGYLIAEAKVGDAEAYEIYKALAQAAIAEHGGRYLVRGGGRCKKQTFHIVISPVGLVGEGEVSEAAPQK